MPGSFSTAVVEVRRLIVCVVARGAGRRAPYVAFRRVAVLAGGRRGGEAGNDLVSVCLMKESQIIPTLSTWALRWPRV